MVQIMNVNPVTAPAPTSTGQIKAQAKSAQAPTPAMDRGQALQRETASAKQAVGSPPQTGITAPPPEINEADLKIAEQLRDYVKNDNFTLRSYHDDNSGRQIIEVRDQSTGDVVSQYPSEELVRLYTSLRQSLVDQSA